ncbi:MULTISPECIES: M48 family metallopeptidase [Pseudanabaena]|uniref:Peptidase M48 Ste24p n=2 Tax=Pseudanabaena TaxID=1152 RepID=L8N0S3_9CYAN|nr:MULTISPECIES: M48 family metallopeptidase [Pseudanabaena]ELS33787.1 peptidase M48 Ste24p [Pseudanabaena biceps PCC 7429]MDG3494009.1 M48 family metalloprotease [Pseudanabaena catenata USMAC16]
MTEAEFNRLVKRLEVFARKDPKAYKNQVWLMAMLGYFYMFSAILFLIGGSVGIVWLGIHNANFIAHVFTSLRGAATFRGAIFLCFFILATICIFFVVAIVMLKSLWINFPKPTGIELEREQFPSLFKVLDELRRAEKAPQLDHVILNREFNASVMQVPRLGILGWNENYLTIGLPLMQALSAEQFRAILAHEFGHLSNKHKIYLIRHTWLQIFRSVQNAHQNWLYSLQGSIGQAVIIFDGLLSNFYYFLTWYIPRFDAYSFVLARTYEYEADRCAVKHAGQRATAEALTNVYAKSSFATELFWQDIHQQAKHHSEPQGNPFISIGQALKNPILDQKYWLEQALEEETNNSDTHPCLSDRLRALGLPAKNAGIFLVPLEISAAETLLGNSIRKLASQFNREWREIILPEWKEQFLHAKNLRACLAELEDLEKKYPLSPKDLWNRSRWLMELEGELAALPTLKALLVKEPDHAIANFIVGKHLIWQKDEKGVDHLKLAMKHDRELVPLGEQILSSFVLENQDNQKDRIQ